MGDATAAIGTMSRRGLGQIRHLGVNGSWLQSALKEKKASANPDKKEDAFYTPEKEVEEIESLIPEIREKITDTRDMQTETNKKLGDKVILNPAFITR